MAIAFIFSDTSSFLFDRFPMLVRAGSIDFQFLAQPGTARHSEAQPGTARHSQTQPSEPGTARHSQAQPGTARHSPGTARHGMGVMGRGQQKKVSVP